MPYRSAYIIGNWMLAQHEPVVDRLDIHKVSHRHVWIETIHRCINSRRYAHKATFVDGKDSPRIWDK